jgi:hypothetical protein
MNLLDAPIANEGFFVTHFFTVKDQEKSKDFYVRVLGGKVIKPENPCYIKLANSWIVLNSGGGAMSCSKPSGSQPGTAFSTCASPTSGPVTNNGAPKERSSSPSRSTTTVGNGVARCAIPTATSSRSANTLRWHSTTSKSTLIESSTLHAARPIQIRWERHSKIKTYGNEIS